VLSEKEASLEKGKRTKQTWVPLIGTRRRQKKEGGKEVRDNSRGILNKRERKSWVADSRKEIRFRTMKIAMKKVGVSGQRKNGGGAVKAQEPN